MVKFALFFSYSSETWARMIDNPSDRSTAVRTAVEKVGGSMEAMYYMFGDQDGFVIIDVPDADTAAAFALTVTSSGAFRSVRTHQLIAPADLPGVLATASKTRASYAKPGD